MDSEARYGRYELLTAIKRGGMGVVYKARDTETGRLAALKVVRVHDAELVQTLRREIHTLARLEHPGIVRIYEDGVADGVPWYAMEYVDADSLLATRRVSSTDGKDAAPTAPAPQRAARDRSTLPEADVDATRVLLSQQASAPSEATTTPSQTGRTASSRRAAAGGSLSPAELLPLTTTIGRICVPLAYLHGEGLVHLDLKPDNILLRESRHPVLVDFGLATILRSDSAREFLTYTRPGAGTLRYMAPEQLVGGVVDARTDIYALGCVFYRLLTGNVPFPGPDEGAIIQGHLYIDPLPPSALVEGIPPWLDDLVLRMLKKRSRERIGYAEDIRRVLASHGAEAWVGELPAPRSYVYRAALAGREGERGALEGALERARALGDGGVVLVGGESGVGKTRLVGELAHTALAQEVEILTGECRPNSGPLNALRRPLQLLGDLCFARPELAPRVIGTRARSLSRYEPALRTLLPDVAADDEPELLPDAAREQLYADLFGAFAALSETTPVLVVLDDVQWADELSLGFLAHAATASRVTASRLLVIATHRVDELPPGLEKLLTMDRVTSLTLGRLDADAVANLVADMLGLQRVPSRIAEALYEHSAGNPLFVTEYLLEAVAQGLLRRDESGTWRTMAAGQSNDYSRLPLPVGIKALLSHRLATLSEGARAVAEIAAVFGSEIDFDMLHELSGLPEAAYFDVIEELERRHVLQGTSKRLAFTHAKVREVTYEQAPDARRTNLHATVGRSLVKRGDCAAAIVAEHLHRGGDDLAALPFALRAGDEARALYALDDAETFYRRAQEVQKAAGDLSAACRTLFKLGLVYAAAFRSEASANAYAEAFRYWETLEPVRGAGHRSVLSVATGEPMSLDPGRSYDTDSAFLQRQLFEGLVELDEESNVVPAVAQRWEIRDQGRVYLFELRPDAKWSDGTPLTAEHFEFAWKRNLAPGTNSPAASLLDVLENGRAYRLGRAAEADVGVRARGPHRLEVRLETPIAFLLPLLAHPVAGPLPAWLVALHGDAWTRPGRMVSNGAFMLTARTEGHELILDRNPHHRGLAKGEVTQVRCRVFRDYRVALEAYANREVDMLDMMSAEANTVARVRRERGDELAFVPIQSTTYLLFRCDRPPFDDPRVRRALALGLDRSKLATELAKTGALPAHGGFVPPGLPGHSPAMGTTFAPEAARKLLASAGVNAATFANATWLHTHGIAELALVEALRSSWREALDVDIPVEVLPWRQFEQRMRSGGTDLVISTWTADVPDPDNFLRTVFHSTQGLGEARFRSVEFDLLVDTAAKKTDPVARLELYRGADRILVADEVAAIPLAYGREPVLVRPWVTSFPRTASWLRPLKNVCVAEELRAPVAEA